MARIWVKGKQLDTDHDTRWALEKFEFAAAGEWVTVEVFQYWWRHDLTCGSGISNC